MSNIKMTCRKELKHITPRGDREQLKRGQLRAGAQLQLIQLTILLLFFSIFISLSYLSIAGRVATATAAAGGGSTVVWGTTIAGFTHWHRVGATWCRHWLPPGLVSVLCGGNRHTRCSCSCSKAVCLAVGQRVVVVVVVAVCNTRCCCCRRLCRCRGGQCVVLVGLLHGVDIAHRTLEIGCKAMQGVNKVKSERDRERA